MTQMKWLCKTWQFNEFKVIDAKNQLRRRTEVFEKSENPTTVCTDHSLEFIKACEELNWNHERFTPHRFDTHGIAERAVRRVKEGTSSVLVQFGPQRKLVGRNNGVIMNVGSIHQLMGRSFLQEQK